MSDVALVYLPYGTLEHPSLALGILKQALTDRGIACQVMYPNVRFARQLGIRDYTRLVSTYEENAGEWTFAGAAFPDFEPNHDEYLERVAPAFGQPPSRLREIREMAGAFIEDLAREIVAAGPRILACSSTFQQHCAALALTRRVKALAPHILTVLGGANCEAEMGVATLLEFPWVDFVVSGEAERIFPDLCADLLSGAVVEEGGHGVLGPAYRRHPEPYAAPPRATADPVRCPLPDFSDYFAELGRCFAPHEVRPSLMLETSRGCWWGEIQHCTFCGLNGASMKHRGKPAEQVLRELDALFERYQIRDFWAVDNILPFEYYTTLLPQLQERGAPYRLFYEVKANISYPQLKLLRDAGVTRLQPGIESLHDGTLKLMAKGCTAWNNVQLLKWAQELGVSLTWNYLCGFPEEEDRWYGEVAEWIPLIEHLEPGRQLRPIRFDRFSPYHQHPERYGLRLQANWAYRYIYPLAPESLARLVYIFHAQGEDGLTTSPFRYEEGDFPSLGSPGQDALQERLRDWLANFQAPAPGCLVMTEHADTTEIHDTRRVAPRERTVLTGVAHHVHRALHGALPLPALQQAVGAPREEVQAALAWLVEDKLVLAVGGRFLALAVAGTAGTRLCLYAAVVGWEGRAFLIPGAGIPLVEALVARGAVLLASEVAVLDESLRVHPACGPPWLVAGVLVPGEEVASLTPGQTFGVLLAHTEGVEDVRERAFAWLSRLVSQTVNLRATPDWPSLSRFLAAPGTRV